MNLEHELIGRNVLIPVCTNMLLYRFHILIVRARARACVVMAMAIIALKSRRSVIFSRPFGERRMYGAKIREREKTVPSHSPLLACKTVKGLGKLFWFVS